jgi:hypothetical protein
MENWKLNNVELPMLWKKISMMSQSCENSMERGGKENYILFVLAQTPTTVIA